MPKVAQLPVAERKPRERAPEITRSPRRETRYFAFLSYSHKDEQLADWLHSELEHFHVPASLAGRLTANGVVPRRLTPIFRDRHELAAADDLGAEIREALAASQYLVVLCSPAAARSRWTNAEIDTFKRTRPDGCVLAAIVDGEPFASDIPGREHEECFPPALRHKYDRRGRATSKRAEPLAADLRGGEDARRAGLLKIVAGMLGVGLDELVQRETTRRHRRLAYLAAASIAGMAVTSTLALVALEARDSARDQRREAEGLVAFMLGDLRDKLEPIGRLDALDGVGSRVLAYYSKQDASELSDAGLMQRSRALSLTAEVANLRGDQEQALKLYQQAMAGTAEAVRRAPDDPQRLFDHAQNVFYVGDISRLRGQLGAAETAYREYKRLADAMVALQPDNLKWRMEGQYAEANLGILYFQQRRFQLADRAFAQALSIIQPLAAVDPANRDYQQSLADALAWLADTKRAQGQADEAIRLRTRQVELVERLADKTRDVNFSREAIPARQALAMLFQSTGQLEPAERELRVALETAGKLISIDGQNAVAKGLAAAAHLELGKILFVNGDRSEAAARVRAGCELSGSLVARDPKVVRWRTTNANCFAMRARLTSASGDAANATALAQRAIGEASAMKSADPVSDRYALASYQRLLGDVRDRAGDREGAARAWSAGLALLPNAGFERPWEADERLQLLQRLGRTDEAAPLASRLRALDYHATI